MRCCSQLCSLRGQRAWGAPGAWNAAALISLVNTKGCLYCRRHFASQCFAVSVCLPVSGTVSAWSVLSAPLVCNTCAQQREVFPKWCGVPGQWQGHHSVRTPAASHPCDQGDGDNSGAAAGCCLASHSPELCEQSCLVPQFRAQHQ